MYIMDMYIMDKNMIMREALYRFMAAYVKDYYEFAMDHGENDSLTDDEANSVVLTLAQVYNWADMYLIDLIDNLGRYFDRSALDMDIEEEIQKVLDSREHVYEVEMVVRTRCKFTVRAHSEDDVEDAIEGTVHLDRLMDYGEPEVDELYINPSADDADLDVDEI